MFEAKVRDMVFSSLIADAYCLGSHWIYDEEQLRTLNVNWDSLNKACAIWHKGKSAGEFTHYGDQTYWFYKFLENKERFYINEYIQHWYTKMSVYDGYIDGATKDTMKNMDEGQLVPCGSNSHDLSIVSRIIPLLLVSKDKEEFLIHVEDFVKSTHNDASVLEVAKFFAMLLLEVLNGKDILTSIEDLKEKFSYTIQDWITSGLASKNEVTFDAIRRFGPACTTDGAFPGVIHLLAKYSNFKEAMIANAKAGGDSSSRAMMLAPLMTLQYGMNKIPAEWTKIKYPI